MCFTPPQLHRLRVGVPRRSFIAARAPNMGMFAAGLLFLAGSANGQYLSDSSITAYSDPAGNMCTLADNGEQALQVYVVHSVGSNPLGVVAADFRVVASSGFAADYVGENIEPGFLVLGDLRSGIQIAYALCVSGSFLVATITYQGHGTSQPCSAIEIQPHPQAPSGAIEVMDCYFDTARASTLGSLYVNVEEGACAPWCNPVSVESSTWGRVKALYR